MNNANQRFIVFMGNLPVWVTDTDIRQWLSADGLACISVKVSRDHETLESRGFAFIFVFTEDEARAIIERFHHAPLEDKLLRVELGSHSKGNGGRVK